MVRKQLYIDESQERLLKARAAAQGVSEAELMRLALDALLSDASGSAARDARWRQLMALSEERRRTLPASTRAWNRDEIHERIPGRGW
jgi:hypothetical protein